MVMEPLMQEAIERGGRCTLDSPVFHESCVLRFEGHDPRRIPACVSDLGKKRKAHKRFFVHAVRNASFSFDTSSALSKVKRITTARKSTSKATCIPVSYTHLRAHETDSYLV